VFLGIFDIIRKSGIFTNLIGLEQGPDDLEVFLGNRHDDITLRFSRLPFNPGNEFSRTLSDNIGFDVWIPCTESLNKVRPHLR